MSSLEDERNGSEQDEMRLGCLASDGPVLSCWFPGRDGGGDEGGGSGVEVNQGRQSLKVSETKRSFYKAVPAPTLIEVDWVLLTPPFHKRHLLRRVDPRGYTFPSQEGAGKGESEMRKPQVIPKRILSLNQALKSLRCEPIAGEWRARTRGNICCLGSMWQNLSFVQFNSPTLRLMNTFIAAAVVRTVLDSLPSRLDSGHS